MICKFDWSDDLGLKFGLGLKSLIIHCMEDRGILHWESTHNNNDKVSPPRSLQPVLQRRLDASAAEGCELFLGVTNAPTYRRDVRLVPRIPPLRFFQLQPQCVK
jgi:hypothetical protein